MVRTAAQKMAVLNFDVTLASLRFLRPVAQRNEARSKALGVIRFEQVSCNKNQGCGVGVQNCQIMEPELESKIRVLFQKSYIVRQASCTNKTMFFSFSME